MSAAVLALQDAAVTRCESLCGQALLLKGAKLQARLRAYTSACASSIHDKWENRVQKQLVTLVQEALAAEPEQEDTAKKKEKKDKDEKKKKKEKAHDVQSDEKAAKEKGKEKDKKKGK